MQAEFALHFAEDFLAGLVEANPDEPVGVLERLVDVADGQVGNALAASVGRAVDDPGRAHVVADVSGRAHHAPDIMAGSED